MIRKDTNQRNSKNEKKELTDRAKQAIATRKRIIRVTKKLVRKKGFESTTIQGISKEAGITVGTFYYYFPSKEALLIEFLPKSDQYDSLEKLHTMHSYVYLVEYYRELVNYLFEDTREVWKCVTESYSSLEVIDHKRVPMVMKIIEEGQRRNEFTQEVSAREIAEMLVLTNHGLFFRYIHDPESIEYSRMALDSIIRIAYSYLTPSGRSTLPEAYVADWMK